MGSSSSKCSLLATSFILSRPDLCLEDVRMDSYPISSTWAFIFLLSVATIIRVGLTFLAR